MLKSLKTLPYGRRWRIEETGEHEMIFSYLKGYPWEERSKWTFVLLQISGSRTLGETTGHLLREKEVYIFFHVKGAGKK